MNLNKKILAAAIVGGLFTTAAQAQVVISATTPAPVLFASELVIPSGGLVLTNAANALNLQSALLYSFSQGEVRHARIECSSNIRFVTGSAVTVPNAAVGAINGIGTNVIHFSITANTASTGPFPVATDLLTVSGNRNVTNTAGGSCSYSLYDQPSQAANGGTDGRIATVTGAYLAFASTFTRAVTPNNLVANVEASPTFSRFVAALPTNSIDVGSLGVVNFALRSPTPRLASGVTATLADILDGTSHHIVTGDFSAAANADGSFTGAALPRVFFSANTDCSVVTTAAAVITATSARFNTGATAFNHTLCYAPRLGVAIPVSTYSHTFNAVAANAGVAPASLGPAALGEITRSGTSLQAPLVQTPTGFISRIVLTNTGTIARPATWNFRPATGGSASEANTTYTGATTGTLNVPANGSIVVSLVDVLGTAATTFGGTPPRGVFTVDVAGPTGQIQGLYQIVNPANGAISNHVMVRPGSN
jgi:hypothetical protein